MQQLLARRVKRRHPFKVGTLPLIVRIYKYPFERWSSHGKQALFGIFNILLFYAYQRVMPVKARGCFTLNVDGTEKRILFNSANTQFDSLYLSVYTNGYEREVGALLDVIMPEQGVFYDIGSNWGYFALLVASNPKFRGRIHAFEPYPSTFLDLQSVVQQAGLTDRIRAHNKALSDETGTGNMVIPDFLHSGWATMDEKEGRTQSHGAAVEVVSLDALDAEPPSVMKIDVERSEAKVLRGGKNLILKHRPLIIFESLRTFKEPRATMEPFWILQEAGYVFFRPTWFRKDGTHSYYLGGDSSAEPLPEDFLTLVPLLPEERFLCHDLLNIFACPSESLPKIQEMFNDRLP